MKLSKEEIENGIGEEVEVELKESDEEGIAFFEADEEVEVDEL
jgi:hypothetical protein